MAYAALYELDLVAMEVDAGVRAKTLQRPALRQALARLKAGEAEALLVVKLDRLTRSVQDLGVLVETYFLAGKWSLMSVSEQIDTRTAAGRMVLHILAAVSQWDARPSASTRPRPWPTSAASANILEASRYGWQLAADVTSTRTSMNRPLSVRRWSSKPPGSPCGRLVPSSPLATSSPARARCGTRRRCATCSKQRWLDGETHRRRTGPCGRGAAGRAPPSTTGLGGTDGTIPRRQPVGRDHGDLDGRAFEKPTQIRLPRDVHERAAATLVQGLAEDPAACPRTDVKDSCVAAGGAPWTGGLGTTGPAENGRKGKS